MYYSPHLDDEAIFIEERGSENEFCGILLYYTARCSVAVLCSSDELVRIFQFLSALCAAD